MQFTDKKRSCNSSFLGQVPVNALPTVPAGRALLIIRSGQSATSALRRSDSRHRTKLGTFPSGLSEATQRTVTLTVGARK